MRIVHYLIYSLWWLLSLLPLWVHYLLSDLIYLLVYRVAHYRVRVVRKNIEESFPEKSADEQRAVERGFYHWFCDYLVESVKLMTMRGRCAADWCSVARRWSTRWSARDSRAPST